MDPFNTYRPMLDLIGHSEGTDCKRGYNETLAYGAYTGGDRDLVNMSLDEIDQLQTVMLAHPNNRWNSSALGRYQIVRTTLRKIRAKLKLSGSAKFDAAMQDRLACFLLGGRGIDRWLAGTMSEAALINALAREWASLPTTKGKGYYGGQHAAVSVSQVKAALAEVKRRHQLRSKPARKPESVPAKPTPTPAPTPAPAPAPAGKGGLLSGLLAALGIGGASADPDRAAAWILGSVIIIGLIIAVVFWRRK